MFLVTSSYSQLINNSESKLGSGVYISLSQLIFPEIAITYEKLNHSNLGYSFSLGYKIPVGKGNEVEAKGKGLGSLNENQLLINPFNSAVYASVAPVYYFPIKHRYFFGLQTELFYRFYWINKKQLTRGIQGESLGYYSAIRTEQIHAPGIKVLATLDLKLLSGRKYQLNTKLFAGPGVTYKSYLYINENSQKIDEAGNSYVVTYEEGRGQQILPSFHAGIKLGIAKNLFKK